MRRQAGGLLIDLGGRWALIVEQGPDYLVVLALPGQPERIPYQRDQDEES